MKYITNLLVVAIVFLGQACGKAKQDTAHTDSTQVNGVDSENRNVPTDQPNGLTMLVDGVRWSAEDVSLNVVPGEDSQGDFDIYIGGNDQLGGFSIRLAVQQKNIKNLKGTYPIRGKFEEGTPLQVYILPNLHDVDLEVDSSGDRPGGYLTIDSVEVVRNGDMYWIPAIKGKFEVRLVSKDTLKSTVITSGSFSWIQTVQPFDLSGDGMKVRINNKEWEADRYASGIELLDDGVHYWLSITGERSGMDLDTSNKGWNTRLFVKVPVTSLTELTHTYTLGDNKNLGEIYFEHGEKIDAHAKGTIRFESNFKVHEGKVSWSFLTGEFEIYGKQNPVKGVFSFTNKIE